MACYPLLRAVTEICLMDPGKPSEAFLQLRPGATCMAQKGMAMNKYGDLLYSDPPPVPSGYRVMTSAERAKIFAPFDALRGFDLALDSKTCLYEEQRYLAEDAREIIEERIQRLHEMTSKPRLLSSARPRVQVEYYVPCHDTQRIDWEWVGTYETITDTVRKVDPITRMLCLTSHLIAFDNIYSIFIL